MANTIVLKRSATPGKVPTTGQLALGEIAINTYDGLIYIKKDDGTPSVVQIGGVTSVNGETGAVTISSDDISDSGQTNKWFSNALARGAVSAGTGISYNSSTGVISTAQSITTSATPTFAGLTLTGGISSIAGSIIPSADITYDLGSTTHQWRDIYVGPGSLYVNGSKVLQDDTGTIAFSADEDQNIRIKTLGNGILQLGSSTTIMQVDSTLQITSGKNITDSSGIKVNFGDNIEMNGNKVIGLGAPSSANDAATKTYVDTAIAAISTSSITQGNSNVTVTDTGSGTVTVTVDGNTALTVDATGVVVAGNFTVSGTTTTVNSNTVSVADNIVTLNSDATGAPTQNAGIEVERGDEANTQLRWNEGSDKWTFTNDGAVYYPMATGTDDLAEGSTNLYHTTARARSSISASSATGVSYNSTTGAISLGSIPNSSLSNSSITINGTAVSLGGTRTLDSDAISEGTTNLYHTTARARSSVSAGTGIAYNSTTGVISTSAIPNASLSNSSLTIGSTSVSLGGTATTLTGLTSVSSTGFTGALTGNADTATTAGKWTTARTITLAGDLTGSVSIDGSANVTLTATVAGDTVALGTDTTGNYVASVTAGTGITVTGTGEGAAVTVSLDTASSVDKTTAQTLTNKSLSDSTTFIIDETDATKKLQFQVSGITTGTTRTLTAPDVSGTIVTTGDTGSVTNTMLAGSIADTKLSTISTAGKVSNSATTATNANTASAIVARDASGNFTAGAITHATSGIFNGSTSGAITVQAAATAGTNTITLPATTGTVVTTGDTGTVTNTMLAGSIANAKLTNSSVTVGTTAIALGASSTTLAGLTSVTSTSFVGALTGNASTVTNGVYTTDTGTVTNTMLAGSIADTKLSTISTAGKVSNSATTATSANTASAIVARDASGNFTAGTITAALSGNATTATTATTTTGNAGTATTLQTARNIQGVSFNGSADITVVTAGTGVSVSGTAVSIGQAVATTSTPTFAGLTNPYMRPASNSATAIQLQNAAGTSILNVDSTNNRVGINNTAPAVAFHVTGAGAFTGELTAYYSDKRLKENIKPIENALNKVTQLHGVTYNANSVAVGFGFTDTDEQVGLLAQDVQAVLPQVVVPAPFDLTVEDGKKVSKSGEDYITVKYEKIVALLVEAIKELNDKVESLEAQLGGSKSL